MFDALIRRLPLNEKIFSFFVYYVSLFFLLMCSFFGLSLYYASLSRIIMASSFFCLFLVVSLVAYVTIPFTELYDYICDYYNKQAVLKVSHSKISDALSNSHILVVPLDVLHPFDAKCYSVSTNGLIASMSLEIGDCPNSVGKPSCGIFCRFANDNPVIESLYNLDSVRHFLIPKKGTVVELFVTGNHVSLFVDSFHLDSVVAESLINFIFSCMRNHDVISILNKYHVILKEAQD